MLCRFLRIFTEKAHTAERIKLTSIKDRRFKKIRSWPISSSSQSSKFLLKWVFIPPLSSILQLYTVFFLVKLYNVGYCSSLFLLPAKHLVKDLILLPSPTSNEMYFWNSDHNLPICSHTPLFVGVDTTGCPEPFSNVNKLLAGFSPFTLYLHNHFEQQTLVVKFQIFYSQTSTLLTFYNLQPFYQMNVFISAFPSQRNWLLMEFNFFYHLFPSSRVFILLMFWGIRTVRFQLIHIAEGTVFFVLVLHLSYAGWGLV